MTYQLQLTTALNARSDALCAGDADAWHNADAQVRAAVAAMRAEARLGLRADLVFTA